MTKGHFILSKYDWMGSNNLKDSHGIAQKPQQIKMK